MSEMCRAENAKLRLRAKACARTSARASSCTFLTSSSVTALTSGGSESSTWPMNGKGFIARSATGAITISGPAKKLGEIPVFT